MTATDDGTLTGSRGWLHHLSRVRLVLGAAALLLAGLWAIGAVSVPTAASGFLLIALAALIAPATREVAPLASRISETPIVVESPIEAVLAGLPDPVVALDHHGDVVALNALASTLAPGLRRGGPLSLGLRMPEVLDAIRRARTSANAQRAEFFQRVPVDRWYEAVVTPISSVRTPHGLFLLAFRDLTPLRRVEEMRADFIANASHELRTPLAALAGFVDTLQGPARDDPAARERFLAIMQAQARRMARLIDDLLSLSRIELNAHVRPDTQVDVVAVVRQVVDSLQTLARDRSVEVAIDALGRFFAGAGRPR